MSVFYNLVIDQASGMCALYCFSRICLILTSKSMPGKSSIKDTQVIMEGISSKREDCLSKPQVASHLYGLGPSFCKSPLKSSS